MSVQRNVSLIVLAVAAFTAGILFTTAGSNFLDFGHDVVAPAAANGPKIEASNQQVLVEPTEAALAVEKTFTEVSERVNRAVVQIRSERVQKTSNPLSGTPFRDFFGDSVPQEFRSDALGSGVIVSEDGYIVTNNHVVDQAEELEVKLYDGRYADATVVGTDPSSDLAVIRIDMDGLPIVPYGNVDDVRIGQLVMAFGSPLSVDLSNSVTTGIVSAIGRTSMQLSALNMYASFIQTDAAINPGNSGGALVNLYGQLIGINSAILSRSGGNQGVGLAIPVDVVQNVVLQLINDGAVSRGFLGITFGPISPALSRAIDIARGAAQVTTVLDGSPAAEAGLREGDVIVAVDGHELNDDLQLRVIIANHLPGDTVKLTYVRNGDRRDVPVTLGRLDPDDIAAASPSRTEHEESSLEGLGLSLSDVTRSALDAAGVENDVRDFPTKGVLIVGIDQSSDAFREAELRQGDVITEVNRKPVASLAEFERTYADLESGDDFIIRVARLARGTDGMQTLGFITALKKP